MVFRSLPVKALLKVFAWVNVTSFANPLPVESISTIYFILAESVAYCGNVQFRVNTFLLESATPGVSDVADGVSVTG
jgi:hypothetical protein